MGGASGHEEDAATRPGRRWQKPRTRGGLGSGMGGGTGAQEYATCWHGLLAISHLNNSFAYSKLNEHIINDIISFSLQYF